MTRSEAARSSSLGASTRRHHDGAHPMAHCVASSSVSSSSLSPRASRGPMSWSEALLLVKRARATGRAVSSARQRACWAAHAPASTGRCPRMSASTTCSLGDGAGTGRLGAAGAGAATGASLVKRSAGASSSPKKRSARASNSTGRLGALVLGAVGPSSKKCATRRSLEAGVGQSEPSAVWYAGEPTPRREKVLLIPPKGFELVSGLKGSAIHAPSTTSRYSYVPGSRGTQSSWTPSESLNRRVCRLGDQSLKSAAIATVASRAAGWTKRAPWAVSRTP